LELVDIISYYRFFTIFFNCLSYINLKYSRLYKNCSIIDRWIHSDHSYHAIKIFSSILGSSDYIEKQFFLIWIYWKHIAQRLNLYTLIQLFTLVFRALSSYLLLFVRRNDLNIVLFILRQYELFITAWKYVNNLPLTTIFNRF
jgi:hypothetical protein